MLPYALLLFRLGLATAFGAAALAKLGDRAGFRSALLGFGLPPQPASATAGVLPPVELLIAAALLVSETAREAATVAVALLGLFTGVVLVALATGRRPSCGCFGRSNAIGTGAVVRNAVLGVVSVALISFGPGLKPKLPVELAAAAVLVLVVSAIAAYRCLLRRGEALLRREALDEATREAHGPGQAVTIVAAAGGAAVAAGTAAARSADELETLRTLLHGLGAQLVRSGRATGAKVKAQTSAGPRPARRTAAIALASERRQLLEARGRLLTLQIQDPRAENARRLAAESLALFAASVDRIQSSLGLPPKTAAKPIAEARQFLEEAIYRGNRAALLLRP